MPRRRPPRARTGRPTCRAASSASCMKNHGCHPFGNAKARAVVWNFPDGFRSTASRSTRRGPTWSPSIRRTTTRRRSGGCRRCSRRCRRRTSPTSVAEKFPLIMTSGRLVEYEGGGEETRSNPWLAELQQEKFVEINPKAANDRGIRDGDYVWVQVADRRADQGQGAGHRARRPRARRSCRSTSRAGGRARTCSSTTRRARAPIVRGEAVNTATTYGYDA